MTYSASCPCAVRCSSKARTGLPVTTWRSSSGTNAGTRRSGCRCRLRPIQSERCWSNSDVSGLGQGTSRGSRSARRPALERGPAPAAVDAYSISRSAAVGRLGALMKRAHRPPGAATCSSGEPAGGFRSGATGRDTANLLGARAAPSRSPFSLNGSRFTGRHQAVSLTSRCATRSVRSWPATTSSADHARDAPDAHSRTSWRRSPTPRARRRRSASLRLHAGAPRGRAGNGSINQELGALRRRSGSPTRWGGLLACRGSDVEGSRRERASSSASSSTRPRASAGTRAPAGAGRVAHRLACNERGSHSNMGRR